jgi:hypothetical protein
MKERAAYHSGRMRKLRIFEPSRGLDTPLPRPLKNARFLCRSRGQSFTAPQSRLKGHCSRGAGLDGPEDLTHKMTAQIRLYAHLFELVNAYYRVSLYAHHVVGVS